VLMSKIGSRPLSSAFQEIAATWMFQGR
jgi:hypothetical protein